jgi:hypothetical protein
LAVKRKVKASVSFATAPVVAAAAKKGDKRRKALGGRTNDPTIPTTRPVRTPAPLAHTDTLIIDSFEADRKAIELTVSPLADASAAYLSGVPTSHVTIGDETPMETEVLIPFIYFVHF